MNKPALVPLREKLVPIPEQLRRWADDMDAGRLPMPLYMLFITDDGEGYELRTVGEMTNMRAVHMLLRAQYMLTS
jgi:hypothetical protein